MDNKVLWFLIFMLIGCFILWLIGSFVTFDLLWFWHSWVGRLIAIVFFLIITKSSINQADEI